MAGPVAAVARAASRQIARTPQAAASRSVHTVPARRSSNGGEYFDYEHRERMYELEKMKHRGLKFGLLIYGGFLGIGIGLPVWIVRFQMNKAMS